MKVVQAAKAAFILGYPINSFVVCHLYDDETTHASVSKLLKVVHEWFGRKQPRHWLYSIEDHGDVLHLNLGLHVPSDKSLRLFERDKDKQFPRLRELCRLSGLPTYKDSCHASAIPKPGLYPDDPPDYLTPFDNPCLYLSRDLPTVVGYMLKGVAPDVAHQLGIDRYSFYHRPQGSIAGKRTGTAQALHIPIPSTDPATCRTRLVDLYWPKVDP
jgi:hypothetical protein